MKKRLQAEVVAPLHEKLHLCKYCGHRLTYRERYKKRQEGKVVCSLCHMTNYSQRFLVH